MPDAPADYTAQALRTESPITPALQTRLRETPRLVHAVLGLLTEAGELADPIKKHIFYGRPVDATNLREEIGDCLWYLAIAADALGTTLEAEQTRNLAKLRTRYPQVFTADAAQVRDLDRERQVLEADVADDPHTLRQQLAAARAEIVATREQWGETLKLVGDSNSHGLQLWDQLQIAKQAAAKSIAERDAARAEVADLRRQNTGYLQTQLDEARAVNVELQRQLDAAHATILAQRTGIERLQAFVEKIRDAHHFSSLASMERALQQLDDQPTPATEPAPCPECERPRAALDCAELVKERDAARAEIERLRVFVETVREAVNLRLEVGLRPVFSRVFEAVAELDQPTPATEPTACPECERLRAVINQIWQRIHQSIRHADVAGLLTALAEIQSNSSPVKESLTTKTEDGQ